MTINHSFTYQFTSFLEIQNKNIWKMTVINYSPIDNVKTYATAKRRQGAMVQGQEI